MFPSLDCFTFVWTTKINNNKFLIMAFEIATKIELTHPFEKNKKQVLIVEVNEDLIYQTTVVEINTGVIGKEKITPFGLDGYNAAQLIAEKVIYYSALGYKQK